MFLGAIVMCVFLGTTTPVFAQSADTGTTNAASDDGDDSGKLGLIGLIGLAGLLGLRRKNDDKTRTVINE